MLDVKTIRWLDVRLGSLACAALTGLDGVLRVFRRNTVPSHTPRRILFIKLIEQGATVLAADALHRAIERVGRENVFFCVFDENRPILDIMDLIPSENIFPFRNDRLGAFAADTWRFMRTVRAWEIDTVVDLEFFSRGSAVLAWLTGARIRVGLHRFTNENPYRGDLMTHRVQYNPYLHTATFYSLLTECAWMDPEETPLPKVLPPTLSDGRLPRFKPDAASLDRVTALLAECGIRPAEQRIVILNPNASDLVPLRKWPLDRFQDVGRRLLEADERTAIIVTGTENERAAAETLCRALDTPRAASLAGRTSLPELLALYTLSAVLVTNDSGPGHFAALTDIASVVLFGPETPERYGPLGRDAHTIWARLACSPCVNAFNHRFSPCTRNRCMEAIGVAQVVAAIRALL
ncbi:MAG: glycosyltransferase family 9 protein [Candidatus Hydrogenedentes bacterium]|nr:glycosyltransferase family 9 protein [Candidatus Hydrogenedentota bacterium]